MLFEALNIHPSIIKAAEDQGYKQPTPIQEKAMPPILKGRDFLGCAQTGTGKTAAFAMPILALLSKQGFDREAYNPVRALILAPTRELAIQIGESFITYGYYLELQIGVIFGGVTPKRHIKVMKKEPNILVATPGRLLDLMAQGFVDLTHVEVLVLDEADRMLDLGMIKEVKAILSMLPEKRQNLMFSATMPKQVTKLMHSILKNPVRVEFKSKPCNQLKILQQVYHVDEPDKTALLLHLLKELSFESMLIFVRTKKKADKLAKAINVQHIRTKAIHGDKNQSERQKALELFKNKEIKLLVATDVAARGIDIDQLSHVVNMNVPNVPETYIHRIGRTGRAGLKGTAITFCSNQEIEALKAIEKLQKTLLTVVKKHPYVPLNIAIKQNRDTHKEKVKGKTHKNLNNNKSRKKKKK